MKTLLDEEIDNISDKAKQKIIINYLMKTYYWAIGSLMFIVGFLLGTIASLRK